MLPTWTGENATSLVFAVVCGAPDAGHVGEMVGDGPGGRHKAVQ